MNTSDLRVRRTKYDIQTGFVKMLQQKSFTKLTINEICEAGMVGRSTFYHHYADKYALLETLVDEQATEFDQLLTKRMTSIQQDQLLINLYRDLAVNADLITTLLTIHTDTADLSQRYRASLEQHLNQLWPTLTLAVPREFILTFYANSALTAIEWALKNGKPEAIAAFMNHLTKQLLVR